VTSLDLAGPDGRVRELEARQKELYDRLAELRAQRAPRERIRELVLELDELDSRLAAARVELPDLPPVTEYAPAPPPRKPAAAKPARPALVEAPGQEDGAPRGNGPKILAAVLAVAALALAGGLLLRGGSGSSAPAVATPPATSTARQVTAAPPAAAEVPVQLHTEVVSDPCGGSSSRTSLHWTWTVPPAYDGQTATIDASGPGIQSEIELRVTGGHVRLSHTSGCLPTGSSWSVTLATVGSTPARLTGVT
jgi:hypothetical protein